MWSLSRKKRVHPVPTNKKLAAGVVRRNGWSLPLHPLQAVAWSFIVFFSVSYFVFLVPRLPTTETRWMAGAINAIVLLTHLIIHLVSISRNPADDAVIARHRSQKGTRIMKTGSFDRSKHEHVIENQFCYICEVSVGPKSKHCSVCNKCISDFDHHCKWLNNCVGSKNYRLFLACVSTAFLGSIIIFGVSAFFAVAFLGPGTWINSSRGPALSSNGTAVLPKPYVNSSMESSSTTSGAEKVGVQTLANSTTDPSPSSRTTAAFVPKSPMPFSYRQRPNQALWMGVVLSTAVLSFIAVVLLGHLLSFHVYLYCSGLSTYEFIVRRRQQARARENRNMERAQAGAFASRQSSNISLVKKWLFTCICGCCRSKQKNSSKRSETKEQSEPDDDIEKISRDISGTSSVASLKTDVCNGRDLDSGEKTNSQRKKLSISSVNRLDQNIKTTGPPSGRRYNKVLPLDFHAPPPPSENHGNVYLGSPHHRLTIASKNGISDGRVSASSIDCENELFHTEANPRKRFRKIESTDTNSSRYPDSNSLSLVMKPEKVDNEACTVRLDSADQHHKTVDRSRSLSLTSNGLSVVGNGVKSVQGNSIAPFVWNQYTRRKREFLRQKSQEQILSKQKYFQNFLFQFEGLGDHKLDTQSLGETPLENENSSSVQILEVTGSQLLASMDKNDQASEYPASEPDSYSSGAASPYFTMQSRNERIRFKY